MDDALLFDARLRRLAWHGPEKAAALLRAMPADVVPKPNVACAACRHPLGIRPPGGPRGEVPPPLVYVRGALREPVQQLLLLGFYLPHDTAALFARLQERGAALLDREMLTGTWLGAVAGRLGERDRDLAGEIVRRVIVPEEYPGQLWQWWTERIGIVEADRWKKSSRLEHPSEPGATIIVKAVVPLPAPIYYRGIEGQLEEKVVYVPVDATGLPLGIRVRCPRCRRVQQLA